MRSVAHRGGVAAWRRHLRRGARCVLIGLAAAAATRAAAQPGAGTRSAVLRGITVDALGRAVGGVSVALLNDSREQTSDSLGHFMFDSVPAGTVTLVVSHPGYVSLAIDLPRDIAETLRVPVLLLSLNEAFERDVAPGALFGHVVGENGRPVADVELLLLATGQRARTDSLGRYMFRRIGDSAQVLQVRKIGYAPQQLTLQPSASSALRADLTLGKLVATLETTVIRDDRTLPRMRPFFRRLEQDRRNQFLTREQIDFRRNATVTDVLTRFRGIGLGYNRNGHPVPLSVGRCIPRVLLNSQEIELDVISLNAIVPLKDVAGIEVYSSRSDIPLDFQFVYSSADTDVFCGVIGIWTRLPDGT